MCKRAKIKLEEYAFVGDSLNDLPVFKSCGFAVAFNPKDEQLRKLAHTTISRIEDLLQLFKI